MSDPYYNQGQYNQQSQYPQGGYGQGYQQGYGQGYGQNYGQQQQQQQNYGQPQGYPQQGYGSQEFQQPHRQNSYGPPQQGGFQHGQAGGQYGAYDASNPQGHAGYYGGGHPSQPHPQQQSYGNDAFAQNQAYQAQMSQQEQEVADKIHPQSSDPNAPKYDPNAPPMTEQDRGLLGAIGGGLGGRWMGKKADHGLLGTVGGAILGSLAEDFMKDKKKKPSNQQSSWGGSKW